MTQRGLPDYQQIAPWLPQRFDSILDIGCGGAWIDVFIANNHGLKTVHLMDGVTAGPKRRGYGEAGLPWRSVSSGMARVFQNAAVGVIGHGPDPSLTIPVDVIISLKSWCHHYPAQHYLPLAKRSLKPGGILVVDVRVETGGEETIIDGGFQKLGAIHLGKCKRTSFVRL